MDLSDALRYRSEDEEEEEEEEEEEGSSVEAEEEALEREAHHAGAHEEGEEVPAYSNEGAALIEVGPNGYAVSGFYPDRVHVADPRAAREEGEARARARGDLGVWCGGRPQAVPPRGEGPRPRGAHNR